MKVAVCGSSSISDPKIAEKAYGIGKELARSKVLVLTGAGNGYPYEAAKGAFSLNGKVFGVSPAGNKAEHVNKFLFPTESFTKIEYTGLGIPGRDYPLVKEADAIIIISGQIGTLNEFTIAFHYGKPIGVLKDSRGITNLIKDIVEICSRNDESENIIFSADPKELVECVIDKNKKFQI